ncbi:FxsA family membrane protein [Streptomyces sp. NPDC059176]|uniref:FxsA family membrane protein n=1 Tax=unclassified Streptomyces TaxID=2593676 RepID=UPI0036B16CE8
MTTGVRTPTAPKRSRARTLVPLGIAAWLVLEIWLLTLVASAAGGVTVFALLVGGGVLGVVVAKRAGRRALRNLTETLQRQQQPGAAPSITAERQGPGNGFVMLAGLLLMIPGLISDVAGLLLLVPPVRSVAGRLVEGSLERRMRKAAPGSLGDVFQQARMHRPDGKVVPGEVIREDVTSPPRPDEGPRPPLVR